MKTLRRAINFKTWGRNSGKFDAAFRATFNLTARSKANVQNALFILRIPKSCPTEFSKRKVKIHENTGNQIPLRNGLNFGLSFVSSSFSLDGGRQGKILSWCMASTWTARIPGIRILRWAQVSSCKVAVISCSTRLCLECAWMLLMLGLFYPWENHLPRNPHRVKMKVEKAKEQNKASYVELSKRDLSSQKNLPIEILLG